MRSFLSIVIFSMSSVAGATNVLPFSQSEVQGGAECVIVNAKGEVLIEDRIKLDGTFVDLKKTTVTATSKSWTGNATKVTFTLSKGKLLEGADGGFDVGKSAIGNLVVIYKGVSTEIKAFEECYGAD